MLVRILLAAGLILVLSNNATPGDESSDSVSRIGKDTATNLDGMNPEIKAKMNAPDTVFENKVNAVEHLEAALRSTPHFHHVSLGDPYGTGLVVLVDQATPAIMHQVPKTYNGYPIKIVVYPAPHFKNQDAHCQVNPATHHLVCPEEKPQILDPQ